VTFYDDLKKHQVEQARSKMEKPRGFFREHVVEPLEGFRDWLCLCLEPREGPLAIVVVASYLACGAIATVAPAPERWWWFGGGAALTILDVVFRLAISKPRLERVETAGQTLHELLGEQKGILYTTASMTSHVANQQEAVVQVLRFVLARMQALEDYSLTTAIHTKAIYNCKKIDAMLWTKEAQRLSRQKGQHLPHEAYRQAQRLLGIEFETEPEESAE
jgi:hypothetical protein